jgi:hypothetical protein
MKGDINGAFGYVLFFVVANTFQIQPFHRDWRSRQMWLFVLCQEHNTDRLVMFYVRSPQT